MTDHDESLRHILGADFAKLQDAILGELEPEKLRAIALKYLAALLILGGFQPETYYSKVTADKGAYNIHGSSGDEWIWLESGTRDWCIAKAEALEKQWRELVVSIKYAGVIVWPCAMFGKAVQELGIKP